MYVRFGISCSPSKDYQTLRKEWAFFENTLVVDSLWLSDHLVRTFKPESPYRDAWSLLPALATTTQRCYIGALVTCNTFRHPSVLVRQALTNDEISGGRFIVGLGAGWYKPEHEILGIPFPTHSVRNLRDTTALVSLAKYNENIRYYSSPSVVVQEWVIHPRPTGPLPILIGGHGPRILEIAATYADIWNSFGTPEQMRQRSRQLDEIAQDVVYRDVPDPWPLEKTIHIWQGLLPYDFWSSEQAFLDTLGAYKDCGLTGFIFDAPKPNQWETFEKCLSTIHNVPTTSPISTAV